MTSVLVVDDDVGLRTTICRDLTSHGFVVSQAEHADEALALLAAHPIDVLLTDLRMPGADGIDLLERIRSASTRTRAILMSGYATARDYERAIECGAVRVLCKPFTSSELLQSIRQAVDCETGFRGSIHGLSLIDLLQMFHFARRSLAIVVDGLAPGHVFLDNGHVIHATYRELDGEPALRTILAMPAGSLRTMVLPPATPHSIARDFQALLLDSLRTLDERDAADRDDELAEFDERPATAPPPALELAIDRLRRLDGYRSALWLDLRTGAVLGSDDQIAGVDRDRAAAGYAELYQIERSLVDALSTGDVVEDIVVTSSHHHLVLREFALSPPVLLCVVLDRTASLGLVRRTLAVTEAAMTRGGAR